MRTEQDWRQLAEVNDWLYRRGDCPSDTCLANVAMVYAQEWRDHRADGMDVLASWALDNLDELVKALRELV